MRRKREERQGRVLTGEYKQGIMVYTHINVNMKLVTG